MCRRALTSVSKALEQAQDIFHSVGGVPLLVLPWHTFLAPLTLCRRPVVEDVATRV